MIFVDRWFLSFGRSFWLTQKKNLLVDRGNIMLPESSRPFLSHTCSNSSGCPCGKQDSGATGEDDPQTSLENPESQDSISPSALKRWALWFLTFFGIYSASSVCPFCGTLGCPVGAGGAVLVGGFFAGLMHYGKKILNMGKRIVAKVKS
jgi:hypothetical protein